MNKKLKIASAAVAVVMAGTMAFGMFGCNNGGSGKGSGHGTGSFNTGLTPNTYDDLTLPTATATTSASEIVSKLNEKAYLGSHIEAKNNAFQRLKRYSEGTDVTTEGKQQKYTVAASYPATTKLKFDVGDDPARSISFAYGSIISGTVTLPDGKQYTTSSLKPAWAALKNTMGLDVVDAFSVKSEKIKTADGNTTAGGGLGDRDIITDGVDTINTYAYSSDEGYKFLDLSNYLEEMPNYAKFLEENPVVRLSLTSNVNTGAMYAAPYFDGNDDIEKYVLFKKNWCESLLDATSGDTTTTFKSHAQAKGLAVTTSASIQAFMGSTGYYNTTVLDKDGKAVAAGIDVNYDKALAAAKNESSPLGAAIKEAAGKAYTTDGAISGNIVDIMNFAINYSAGEVTGAQLLKIMQEYIKVAYYVGSTNTPFYTQDGYKLSDVFNGYCAAWDVDLYAALGRVLVTNPSLVKSGSAGNTVGGANATTLANLYLVANRQGNMQRQIDATSFVGELYGVRGLESRNIYSYIDANGELQDPRGDYESYEAFNAFSKFYAEGLATEKGNSGDGESSFYVQNSVEAMSYHDYSNTQTPGGFQTSGIIENKYSLEEGYNFTSILTPVSKWNTKSQYDSETFAPKYDTYMRFTESWRSVKNTGFAVPLDAVKNDSAKLKAVLSFIDYLFSDDGQIEMSYGPMASNADSTDGFWYNREATAAEVSAGKYFTYKGKNYYSDVYYAKKYQPTVTQKVKDLYYGKEVNNIKADGSSGGIKSCVRSYTNFARYVIGSALPIGNKLQSFEFQMTSKMGLDGASIVSTALDAGIIKHVVPDITGGAENNPWYACVPTLLPYTEQEKAINTQAADVSQTSAGKLFTNNKNSDTNLYWEIIKHGYDASQYLKTMCGLLELTGMSSD